MAVVPTTYTLFHVGRGRQNGPRYKRGSQAWRVGIERGHSDDGLPLTTGSVLRGRQKGEVGRPGGNTSFRYVQIQFPGAVMRPNSLSVPAHLITKRDATWDL